MLDLVRGFFERVGRTADAQQQREATIDLLVWTMYADNRLALSENDRIDQIAASMPWSSPTSASQYLLVSISRVRDAIADERKAEDLLESIHARLGNDRMRREAYNACRELANSDGQIADNELALLNRVKERFGIAS